MDAAGIASADEIRKLEDLVAREPDNAKAWHNLGVLNDRRGRLGEAERCYRRAAKCDPELLVSRRNLASLLLDRGNHDESRELYRSLIAADPRDADAHYAYGKLSRYEQDDPVLIALQELSERIPQLDPDGQIKACFTVAKANQDLGRYDDAFEAFRIGNDLHYRRYPYNEPANFAMLDDVKRCMDERFFAAREPLDIADNMPIFVLGMPRSGSTLVEQILASHSDVTGAGELKYLKSCVQKHLIRDRATFSNAVASWSSAALRDAASCYLDKLRPCAGGATRVVDKMPGNFAFIGLIRVLFPNARIIHTTRHPMATIWSNYSTLFGDALHYTYRLDVLTRYYLKYRELMAHWDSVLPAGAVFHVEYERLVQEPESTIRNLISFLELDWQPACLDFHATRREIKTASTVQVRQPLYTSAIEQWRNYRERLSACEDALVPR